ncbi:hypothetical protein [Blautia massiliensis (ex Durand et al. 2017)]|uniref:hypothetical protein n=1 Tax=Blautia massiliensis (ex Durand et al. 2017) TaxID=1737424 RepID=UPI002ED0B483
MGEIKITRKLLDNYKKIKREIPILGLELDEMKNGEAGLGNSVILDGRTGINRPQSVVGFDQERYDRRKRTYEHKNEQVAAVDNWIQNIEDGQTRYVFKAFYQQGLTWEKIAEKTGYSQSPDYPRLYIRDIYLKKCEIK